MAIPSEFVLLVLALVFSKALSIDTRWDVNVVGSIPGGLPSLTVPSLGSDMVGAALANSIILAVIGFAVSIAIGKTFEKQLELSVRPNQELLAMGIANVFGSFLLSYPSCGSLSRSVVSAESGVKSPINILFSSTLVAIIVAVLTGPFEATPQAVLAAVILVALKRLLLQVRELPALYRIKRADGLVWAFVFTAVLVVGVTEGLILGMVFSLLIVLYKQMRPYTAVMGRFPGTRLYGSVAQYGDQVVEWPRIKIVHFGAELFYANVAFLEDTIEGVVRSTPGLAAIVLDISTFSDIDISSARDLSRIHADLTDRHIRLLFAHPRKRLRSLFAAEKTVPIEDMFIDVHDACLYAMEVGPIVPDATDSDSNGSSTTAAIWPGYGSVGWSPIPSVVSLSSDSEPTTTAPSTHAEPSTAISGHHRSAPSSAPSSGISSSSSYLSSSASPTV
ncbi:sulfate transporter [Thecamonas trahens ATCC 50062]|uniref:Sulfate transporter n=1 Tax=Thecamonas trahens ATCC 50062 TaxID=461836 RepID=A0A0L0D689_THETB|nr:sulfate transporter [Thecamonas trahens ATCC 50062]KNC47566.1 sulfate transporter [Thecamonas trahens ATCC 50062]|eukprot:XP_013759498.1 sulfate transporter [Thecamonas trahens ATCC 50062]